MCRSRQQGREPQRAIRRQTVCAFDRDQTLQPRKLQSGGKNFAQNSLPIHQRNNGRGIFRLQQQQQFFLDTLSGKKLQSRFLRDACFNRLAIRITPAIPGVKAEEAKDAKIVFPDSAAARRR